MYYKGVVCTMCVAKDGGYSPYWYALDAFKVIVESLTLQVWPVGLIILKFWPAQIVSALVSNLHLPVSMGMWSGFWPEAQERLFPDALT